jgi:hypothetical protein
MKNLVRIENGFPYILPDGYNKKIIFHLLIVSAVSEYKLGTGKGAGFFFVRVCCDRTSHIGLVISYPRPQDILWDL